MNFMKILRIASVKGQRSQQTHDTCIQGSFSAEYARTDGLTAYNLKAILLTLYADTQGL
jgi:hypothetical protein